MNRVAIRCFGPLEVRVDGQLVCIDGPVRRRLLGLLIARRGTTCRQDWLIDSLWGDAAVSAAGATLQSHIAHLRRRLEPHRLRSAPWTALRSVPGGYLLDPGSIDLDVDAFLGFVRRARSTTDRSSALAHLEAGLALARAEPFEDLRDLVELAPQAAHLDDLVVTARELRIDALADLGRDDEVVAAAREVMTVVPHREHSWRALATSLARLGRHAEALRALHQFRTVLADDTGLSASPVIDELEQVLLAGGAPVRRPVDGCTTTTSPPLHYATVDGVHIAYQAFGSGPAFVAAPPLAQNIEICWQDPRHRRLLERAGERCRFVHFDKRGTGMSDRAASLEFDERLRDFEAVLDDAGVDRAVLCGVSEAGPLAIAFAVAHPERVTGLYLVNTFARTARSEDYPIGLAPEAITATASIWERAWGHDPVTIAEWFAPSLTDDPQYLAWLAHYMRQSCSPGTLAAVNRANLDIDVRHLLARVTVPTVVVHRSGDRVVPVAWGRYLAANIPGAELWELPGVDHLPWVGDDWAPILDRGIDLAVRTARSDSPGSDSTACDALQDWAPER